MADSIPGELTPLQKAEARRAARAAGVAAQRDEQRAIDLDALFEIEEQLGEANVSHVLVPYEPGGVTLVAVRLPAPLEFKRCQDKLKNNPKDPSTPIEEVGRVCCVYPIGEAREALLMKRPGLPVELGQLALQLAAGKAVDEGKG